MVETAIIIVVLAVFVFGVVDLGRGYQLGNQLSGAAREGAAYGQYHPGKVSGCSDGETITSHAKASESSFVSDADLTISVVRVDVGGATTPITGCNTGTTINAGDRIRVTATHHFNVVTPLIAKIVGNQMTISRTQEVVFQG